MSLVGVIVHCWSSATECCHHSVVKTINQVLFFWRWVLLDADMHSWTHMRVTDSDAWSHASIPVTVLAAHAASRLSKCTTCKSRRHLSTFQPDGLKGDSWAPILPPSIFFLVLVPSFSLSLSLMTKLLGGPSDRSDPCARADAKFANG